MTANQHEEGQAGEGEWRVQKSAAGFTELVGPDFRRTLYGAPDFENRTYRARYEQIADRLNAQQATITRLEDKYTRIVESVSRLVPLAKGQQLTNDELVSLALATITRLERELGQVNTEREAWKRWCEAAERERGEAQKYAADLQVSVSEKMHTLEHDNYRLGRDRDRYKVALEDVLLLMVPPSSALAFEVEVGRRIRAALTKEGEADESN